MSRTNRTSNAFVSQWGDMSFSMGRERAEGIAFNDVNPDQLGRAARRDFERAKRRATKKRKGPKR